MDWGKYPDRFWHCKLKLKGENKRRHDAILNDATKGQIQTQLVRPWHQNSKLVMNGCVVNNRDDVQEIQVVYTQRPLSSFEEALRLKNETSRVQVAIDARTLPFGEGTDVTHELLFETYAIESPAPDTAMLIRLCERLPEAVRSLSQRRKGKTPFTLDDEYDAQDLLRALIRAYFKHTISEEPIGKAGGTASSRVDIAIEALGALVEVKYAREAKDQSRFVRELGTDFLLYSEWKPLKTLICVIVNSGVLEDPEALEKLNGAKDLNGKKFEARIVLA